MTQRVQDLVIGGGVVGVNCAHALADAGRSVVIIEKGEICSGCSHGNAGWIAPCHSLPIPGPGLVRQTLKWMLRGDSPLYIKPTLRPAMLAWLWRFFRQCNPEAARRGLVALAALHREVTQSVAEIVERHGLDCEFSHRGNLYVFRNEKTLEKAGEELALMREHGIEGTTLSRDEVLEREPAIDPAIRGGIFYAIDADVVPHRFVAEVAERLPGMGVRIETGTAVEGFVRANGAGVRAVKTTAGEFEPENIVLASGSWSTGLARKLGIKIPLQPGKGYSITYRAQAGTPRLPLYLADAKIGATPWKDTFRLAGTMELAGLQLKINQRRVDAIVRGAKQHLPGFKAENVLEVWAGMRPVCSDALPIIGAPAAVPNVYFATGHAMLGLTQSVVTGKLIAQLITGQVPSVPLEPFSPDRF
jgi:D-amino-acid dehydrogenase